MFPIKLSELGVDFYAGAGHKWQCGPLGTGFLYIRNRTSRGHNPLPLIDYQPLNWFGQVPNRNVVGKPVDIGMRVMGFGSHNTPTIAGFVKACELWDAIGRDRIAQKIRLNTVFLHREMRRRFGIGALMSPVSDASLHSGLVTFNPSTVRLSDHAAVTKWIETVRLRSGYVLKAVPVSVGADIAWSVRIAPHFWHNEADLAEALEVLEQVMKSAAA
jgi:isopenicillin-N epimerase